MEIPNNAVVNFMIGIGKKKIKGWMAESERPINLRKDYEESKIHKLTAFKEKAIQIGGNSGASPIEVVTSLAVLLHKTFAPPPTGKKWLDTRLHINRPLTQFDAKTMKVDMVQTLGDRLTKSLISVPGESLGHIYFSLGSP